MSEANGEAFVKTANLDGESSLKRKTAVLQDKLEFNGEEVTSHDFNLLK